MKIIVTRRCQHPDGYTNHESVEGSRAVIDADGVLLDGEWAIQRDRGGRRTREPGHPWVSYGNVAWTTFTVTVEP